MTQYANRISVMKEEVEKFKVMAGSLGGGNAVSFAAGAPAKEAYPFDVVREIASDVFQDDAWGLEAFKYGVPRGIPSMRKAVCDALLVPRGLQADPDDIMITSGGIEPLNIVCQLYLNPGDVILVETPTFGHAAMLFKLFEARLIPCETDEYGLVMEDVEEKIQKYHAKMIYTIPTFQNPTGRTLPEDRRRELAELGSRYDVMILEDDPYREIRYSGEELPMIKSFDRTGNTIYAGSMSKIFSPGARLGYLVADEDALSKMDSIRYGTDTSASTFSQVICAEFFRRGYYEAHRQKLCDLYRERRDAMVESLDRYFPDGTRHTYPDGGYYVWVEMDNGLNLTDLSGKIKDEVGIVYGLGSSFFSEGNPAGAGDNCMRLNFSGLTPDVIRRKLQEFGDFLKAQL